MVQRLRPGILAEAVSHLIGGHDASTVDEIQDRIIQTINAPGVSTGKSLWPWFVNLEFMPSQKAFRLHMDPNMSLSEAESLKASLLRDYADTRMTVPPTKLNPALADPGQAYAAMYTGPDETILFIIPVERALEDAQRKLQQGAA